MKITDIKTIWLWIDKGYSLKDIAEFTYIDPDIIDIVAKLKKIKVDLKINC